MAMAMAKAAATTSSVPSSGNDELLDRLKAELRGDEQQLFLAGFHLYLQHDTRKDFVIDLDDVYPWLGFTRKDNVKRLLAKSLQEDVHYKISLLRSEERVYGGQNKEKVLMTVHGFKQLCMKADTDKARRVREYPKCWTQVRGSPKRCAAVSACKKPCTTV